MYIMMGALAVCSVLYVVFVELNAWPADIDTHNLASGIKNGYLVLGSSCGMLLSCALERKYINFPVKAPLGAQVAKVVLGLALVLGLKAGLKPICVAIFGGHEAATALRYFLLVLFAACVWPLTFRWFSKGCPLGRRAK